MSFLWYSGLVGRTTRPHRLSQASNWQDDGFGNCICTFDTAGWYFVISILLEDLH